MLVGAASVLVWAAVAILAPASVAASQRTAAFPPGFLWGTALAGFQAEAGDGRNLDPNSDWFAWTHDRDNIDAGIVSGELPEDGPGHWSRFRTDLDLAAGDLHNNAFRFSIEWPRIFPRSTEGIDVGRRIGRRDLTDTRLDEYGQRKF